MNSKYQSAGELIDFSIGGGWGKEEPAADYSNKVAIVRGADFPDVDNGIFDRIPVRWEKETKATKASLKAGDVILEISGGTDERPTGRTVRVSQELLDSFDCPVIPASFCRLVRPNEYVNPQYFYYWLQDMYAKGRTWNYQNRSTGLSNFQFKVFCEAEEVRVPSYNEQCAIAEVLCLIDKKRMANIKLNNHLYESKTGGCRGHPLFRRCKLHGPLWSLEWIYHLSNTGEQLIAHRGSNQIIRFASDRSSRDLLYRIQGHS